MRILFVFYNHPTISVIPRSILNAFRKEKHEIITCGRSENGLSLDISYDSTNISLLTVLQQFKKPPEAVFVCWPSAYFFLTDIEKSTIPTVVYVADTHLPLMHLWMRGYVELFDYVFCAQKKFYTEIKKKRNNVFWCPFAADLSIHKPYKTFPSTDIVFAGVTNPLHNPRRSLYLKILSIFFRLRMTRVYSKEYGYFFSEGKIIFNIPVTDDLNARVFEAMACGRLLLTSRNQQGLLELFINKKHLVTYNGIIDLIRQVRFYLSRDDLRAKIAYAGQKEVYRYHSYIHRVRFILKQIKKRNLKLSKQHFSLFHLFVSFYFLGAPEAAFRLFDNFRILNKSLWYLQSFFARNYSRISALQILMWQLTHF